MARGRHVRKRRFGVLAVAATLAAIVVLSAGGAAFAAYRYEQARGDVILPGVAIDGVEVGAMDRREALRTMRAAAGERLQRALTIKVADRRYTVTPSDLGERAAIARSVDEALAFNETLGTFDRFWHRVRQEPLDVAVDLAYRTGGDAVEELARSIADDVFEPWTNASIGLADGDDELVFTRGAPGRKLPLDDAVLAIREALVTQQDRVVLEPVTLRPKVTERSLGPTIVVRVDDNRLDLYEGFEVVKTWEVATAKPGWITPTGVWTIWDKRVNPTWYNPALDSWGASLPAVVPGGPNGPMGTRAIYIDAPGLIRVHGTPSPSSIGRYASHGCIRMRNAEVEELFEMIPVGAKVVIVGHRPAGAQEWDTPASADI
jgi:lipoprotein-anchoring transpeptidase ErfK/SrfK